jgi:hypothetical protein
MAASTSRAAPSMSRSSPNSMVMLVEPVLELEVISATSEMRPRRRSKGVATLVAMVSGLAPGNWAWTWTAGKSTCGSGETGRWK